MARAALLPLVLLAACAPRRTLGARRPFSAAEFESLKRELHTLSRDEAESRFAEVAPRTSPPPRQDKIDHGHGTAQHQSGQARHTRSIGRRRVHSCVCTLTRLWGGACIAWPCAHALHRAIEGSLSRRAHG